MADEGVFQNQGNVRAIYNVSLGVSEIGRARAFYGAVFEPLGYRLLHEVEENGQIVSLGWGLHWPELWTNLPAMGARPHPGAHAAHLLLRPAHHSQPAEPAGQQRSLPQGDTGPVQHPGSDYVDDDQC